MTKDELLALCAAYPGAAVDCPFEDGGNVVVRHAAGCKYSCRMRKPEREG